MNEHTLQKNIQQTIKHAKKLLSTTNIVFVIYNQNTSEVVFTSDTNTTPHNLPEAKEIIDTKIHETDTDVYVTLPISCNIPQHYGILWAQIPITQYTQRDNAILQMVGEQITLWLQDIKNPILNIDLSEQLLTISESISELEQSSNDDPQYIVDHIGTTIQKLGWESIRVIQYDKDQENIAEYAANAPIPPLPQKRALKPFLDNAVAIETAYFVYVEDTPTILIPVKTSSDEIVATIELQHHNIVEPPLARQLRPIMLLANHYGNLVDRLLLIRSLRQTANLLVEQVDELEFIRKADREISSRLDPSRIIMFCLDWALRRTAAEAGCIVVIDTDSKDLLVQEILGYPPDKIELLNQQKYKGVIGRAIKQKQTQLVEDVTQDEDYIMILPKTQTQLVVPLLSHKRTLGAIMLESRVEGRFDPAAVSFVERVSSISSIALDNAQLLQQAEQLADDMSLMYNAGRTISSSLEWDNTIESIAQGMALAVTGSNALIYEFKSQSQIARLLSRYTTNKSTNTQMMPSLGSTLNINQYPNIKTAIENGNLLVINSDSPESPEQSWLNGLESDTAAIAPLIAQGTCVGLAILVKAQANAEFANSEIFVAESLATQAAAVLRQASLYTEVQELEVLKSEMIRMASHDLRAPIANIIGYMNLIRFDLEDMGQDNEDMQMYMDSIDRSVKSMQALVEDLLTLEKIESQRNAEWEIIEFDTLVTNIFEEQTDAAKLKKQNFTLSLPKNSVRIRGIDIQIKQAISNLIGNGIKYTPEHGRVELKVEKEKDEGGRQDRIYFRVIDNGYGIDENRQKRIFQRFYRAKQPGTEHITGTGLGLSLVKSIIERHNGEIYFESEVGKGSTFTFWLPLPNDIN